MLCGLKREKKNKTSIKSIIHDADDEQPSVREFVCARIIVGVVDTTICAKGSTLGHCESLMQ